MGVRIQASDVSANTAPKNVKASRSTVPRHLHWPLYVTSLVLSDMLMTLAALWLAYYLRFELLAQYFDPRAIVSLERYRLLFSTGPLLWLSMFAVNGLYVKDNLLGGTSEYSRVFRSASGGVLTIIVVFFLEPTLIMARGWLVMAWALAFFFVAVARFGLRRVVYALRRHGFFLTPAVIVGANEEGHRLAEQLLRWETSGLQLVGLVDQKVQASSPLFHGLVCLGSVNNLGEIIERYKIGEVILASSAISTRDNLLEIFRKYGGIKGLNIRMSSGLYEILTTSMTVNEYAYVPLVHINKVRLTGLDTAAKFIVDYLLSIFGLLILLPILLLIALLVKLTSPGPVLYRRRVMGLKGKQFDAFKFRTMAVNGDEILEKYPALKEELAREHKLKNDPRVTRIGAILRRYSLDELPQVINVLKREMSWVGPRMISPEEMSMYKQFDMNLLTVLPGITGLWQVSGRSDISYEERVRLDMYYIRNWSLWLDFQLLFQTFGAVLGSHGAY